MQHIVASTSYSGTSGQLIKSYLILRIPAACLVKNKWMYVSFDSVGVFLNVDLGWLVVVWDLRRAKPVIRYQTPTRRVFSLIETEIWNEIALLYTFHSF